MGTASVEALTRGRPRRGRRDRRRRLDRADRRVRRRGRARLHPARRSRSTTSSGASSTACTWSSARQASTMPRSPRCARCSATPSDGRADRPQLLDRRRADDEVRRDRGAVLRVRRGHRDAPSGQGRCTLGTATRTAELIASARADAGSAPLPDATDADPDGARGAKVAGVPVHSVRARGFVASQDVVFGGVGETLSIRHDSSNRDSFMPGVVAAVRAVSSRPGVTVGLECVLGL